MEITLDRKSKMYNEISLIEEAVCGNKESFRQSIDIYKSYLYKTAFLYVKNENDAIEIYQNTVYKAFISIKTLRKPEYFKTWITRILINNANDLLRDKLKNVHIDTDENIIEAFDEGISIEEKVDLYEAIDKLSKEKKTAIILKYIHGFSIKEISEIMNSSENTVKSHIRRAKSYMLQKLKGGNNHEQI